MPKGTPNRPPTNPKLTANQVRKFVPYWRGYVITPIITQDLQVFGRTLNRLFRHLRERKTIMGIVLTDAKLDEHRAGLRNQFIFMNNLLTLDDLDCVALVRDLLILDENKESFDNFILDMTT